MNSGGRKIKRSKNLYGRKRRSKTKTFFMVLLTIVIVAVLIFLGYSIGEPIVNFFKNGGYEESTVTEPWTPPVTTTSADEKVTTTEKTIAPPAIASGYNALILTKEDIITADALAKAIAGAKEKGYTAVALPLKSQGGSINYNSKIPLAVDSGAVVSNITLSEMVKAVKSAGLIPIAKVSILNDNIAPKFNRNLSYKIENSDSLWFDNNVQSGGKPWISPFEADTQEYISQIAKEISSAGFTQVICTDVAFPEFRQSDITYVGEIVKNANRYETLLNTFNTYKENSEGAQVLLEVSAAKILSGTEEVFVPEKLENTTVVVKFTPTDFEKNIAVDGTEIVLKGVKTYDKVKMIFEKVKAKSAELTIVPCINKQAYSDADLAEAKKALTDLGYKFIIVQ